MNQNYVYFPTSVGKIGTIATEGLQLENNAQENQSFIVDKDTTISLPVKRSNCIRCYLDIQDSIYLISSIPTRDYKIEDNEAVSVFNINKISNEMYIGDSALISDAVDFQYMEKPDDVMISESYEDAVKRYADTFEKVEDNISLQKKYKELKRPELLIQGDIPSDAFVEVFSPRTVKQEDY